MPLKPMVGTDIPVHSYKHNGKVHRVWDKATVLDVNESTIITATNRALVIEADGRTWKTIEPAINYFFEDRWFNVIAILRPDGTHFYCNLSSPVLYHEGALKYIDYDLDVKVFPNYRYKILDEYEFLKHKKLMNYSPDIEKIVRAEMKALIEMVQAKKGPFRPGFAKYWYDDFKKRKLR